jgi:hypothetical protein
MIVMGLEEYRAGASKRQKNPHWAVSVDDDV